MDPGQRTILYVEDDIDDVTLFRIALHAYSSDYHLTTAGNGQMALDKLGSLLPDFIFMDINMPVMDGFTCLTEIRNSLQHLDHIPITILTSSHFMKDEAFKRGADFFFIKPIDQEEWFEIFTNVLSVWHESGFSPSL